jgi:four helix bundle protein
MKTNIKSYRDLEVYQRAMKLIIECYKTTDTFPKNETLGLASQLQRAAVSMAANIAEGHSRQYTKEFLQSLSIAHGSRAEVETHIVTAERLKYIDSSLSAKLLGNTAESGRMLNGLRRSLENLKKNRKQEANHD